MLKSARQRRILWVLLPALLVGSLLLIQQFWKFEEETSLNWLFQWRGAAAPPDDVVVVAIDLESTNRLGLKVLPNFWPWARDMHARLIDELAQAGADIIVLDLFFHTKKDAEHDRQLADAIKNAGNVIIVERLRPDIISEPQSDESGGDSDTYINCIEFNLICEQRERIKPEIIASEALAHAPFPLPKESLINSFWTFKPGMGDAPTLPVVVFQAHTLPVYNDFLALLREVQAPGIEQLPQSRVKIGDIEDVIFSLRQLFVMQPGIEKSLREKLRTSQLDQHKKQMIGALISLYSGDNMRYLNLYGPSRSIHTIPAYQVLQSDESTQGITQTSLNTVAGKVVFVGLSATTHAEIDQIRDTFPTAFTDSEKIAISGVEIAATAFANLLENKPIKSLPYAGYRYVLLIIVIGLALGIVLSSMSRINRMIFAGIAFEVVYLLLVWQIFELFYYWLPLITPFFMILFVTIGAVILKYREERDQLLALFGQYSPDKVVDKMTGYIDPKLFRNRNSFAACLFTDIQGYAGLAEEMDREDRERLNLLLDSYFSILIQCVQQNNGNVVDRIGDGMMAVWEVTGDKETVRRQVCEAGLAIKNSIGRFNNENNHPALPTRIGIHFGELLIARRAFAVDKNEIYRVVGNLVNTASRIESANEHLVTTLLVTRDVLKGGDQFLTRPLGHFRLKGLKKPVELVELIAHKQKAGSEQIVLCEMFADALDAYLKQRRDAIEKWSAILQQFPGDGPTWFYLDKCAQSSPDQWRKTIELAEK